MFPSLLYFFWLLLQIFTVFSLTVPAILCALYFIRMYRKPPQPADDELHEEKDYAIIVSAFEPAANIQALLRALQQLNYTNYIVYVAGLPPGSGDHSGNDKVVYLRTAGHYGSQVLLHRFIIENFRRPHTHVAILDSHHLVDENYLTNLNTYFHEGYQAVKSCEIFRSPGSTSSLLQWAITAYRSFFTGKMMFGLGSSATLSTSGIAFTVTFFKQCLKKIKTSDNDFASALQTLVTDRGHQVAFASQAVVYHTVPVRKKELARHHALHIHLWLINLFFYSKTAVKGAIGNRINHLLYGILAVRLPLPTSILIAMACMVVNAKIHPVVAFFWAGILMLLPVYLLVAAKQLTKPQIETRSGTQTGEESFESLPLYGEEEYSAIAQTV